MTQDAQELWVPGNGGISVAPVGTAAPTDATTALPVAWQDLGYTDPSGVAVTPSITVDQLRGWQSAYPLRRVVTERDLQAKAILLQVNYTTLGLFLGGAGVSGASPNYTLTPPPPDLIDTHAWVIEGFEGSGGSLRKQRLYFSSGLIVAFGDWVWSRAGAASLDITIGLNVTTPGSEWRLFVSDAQFSAT